MARRKTSVKWQMHESSQRGLCRTAFVLFGVGPLLLVITFSIAQFIPAYQEQRAAYWSTWLSGRLGVDVQVAAVESLAPERFVLHGLRLSHPESRAALGRIRSVTISRRAAKWSIQLDQTELENRHLAATWRIVHDWFVCRPQLAQPAIRIECNDLRLRDPDEEQALEQLAIEIYTQSERTVVGAEFRMPTTRPDSPASLLRIVRQHSDRHLLTVLELDSGPTDLPCKLVSPALPEILRLGDHAVFRGKLSLTQRNSAWQVNLSDSLIGGIDFGRWTSGLNSFVTGEGLISCENFKVTDRGLQYAYGKVTAEDGRINGNLLKACQQRLGVTVLPPVQTSNVAVHSFEQLQAYFEIAPGTIKLVGGVETTRPDAYGRSRPLAPGTLIADAAGEIAHRSSIESIPIQNLVSTLDYGQVVPATANSTGSVSWLAQRAVWWLPLERTQPLLQADATYESNLR